MSKMLQVGMSVFLAAGSFYASAATPPMGGERAGTGTNSGRKSAANAGVNSGVNSGLNSGANSAPNSGNQAGGLDGTWTNTCQKGEADDGDSTQNEVTFSGSTFKSKGTVYQDDMCTAVAIVYFNEGKLTFGEGIGSQGARKLDLFYQKLSIRVESDKELASMNSPQVCGRNFFKKGEVKEIKASDCSGFFGELITQSTYDIYKLDGITLSFGLLTDEFDGSSDKKRPNTLDPATMVKK